MHVLLLLAALLAAAETSFVVQPPPGWSDVTASRAGGNVVCSLKGPETSSFVLTRIEPIAMENRAAVRNLLLEVLRELEKRSQLGLKPATNLLTATFSNGLTAQYIRAEAKDKPKVILAVTRFHDAYLMATLVSAVPDTLLPSIMGGIRAAGPAAGRGSLDSVDGQLTFPALAGGLAGRELSARERKANFVAALRGMDSELLVVKLVDDNTPIDDQPELVRQTVAAVQGAVPSTQTPLRRLATSAGTEVVYGAVELQDKKRFAAGYMPWAYWGYSVVAKGPRAEELLSEALAGVKPGPGAQPGLVAATPRLPASRERRLLQAGFGLLLIALAAGLWRWRAKKG